MSVKFEEDEVSTWTDLQPATQRFSPVRGRLVLWIGSQLGRTHLLGRETLLGRGSDMDVVADDPEVSRRHGRIRADGDRFVLEDLGSRNGTRVNGVRLEAPRVLEVGDRIQIGSRHVLLFTHQDPVEERVLQRQKLEAIGRLGAGIAHDFNNLLGAIVSSIEYLEGLPPGTRLDAPHVREGLTDVRQASERAVDLTRRLVMFARQDSASEHRVDLASLCTEVVEIVARTFGRALEVVADVERGIVVRGDPAALHQLLMNLCINAHDAMRDGGTLTLRLARMAPEDPPREEGAPQERCLLEVSDTGAGMDSHTRAQAFDPFFTTKTHEAGAGLGLSTVLEVATSHGGLAELDSEPGRGTTVRVQLPLAPAAQERDPTPTPRRTAVQEPVRRTQAMILLADDEPLVRRSTTRLLERAGHRVLCAGDGEDAVRQYDEAEPKPDLVILDLDMPSVGGELAFERLRALEPGIRVIFISGHWDPERERALQAAGAAGVLRKPYDARTFCETVERVLGRSAD